MPIEEFAHRKDINADRRNAKQTKRERAFPSLL